MTLESLFYWLLYNRFIRPKEAEPTDQITVFLKNKKYDYDLGKKVVNAKAFLPRPYDQRLETSVFNIQNLIDAKIWRLGHLWTVINRFGQKSGQSNIKARGDFAAKIVEQTSTLNLRVDPSPHPRHHNILGWSGDSDNQELAALELVRHVELQILPK